MPAARSENLEASGTTKGERTAARILDAAEAVFAESGFQGASLREIARRAGIQQPGLYNHFASKRDLYAAVLDRALTPMTEAMADAIEDAHGSRTLERLLTAITDVLLEHPQMAALFQQALHDGDTPGQELMRDWLDRLLAQGVETARSATREPVDRAQLAIGVVAMFNVTTGYFLSQRALDGLGVGALDDPANVARQKALLERVGPAAMRR
ncbi:MAG: TetR/AcrR family transcriptional regulator [bacterium]|nr:TetR/AcrR family transcriptional regulator [bacterium]